MTEQTFAPSDPAWHHPGRPAESLFGGDPQVAELRPHGVGTNAGGHMQGRPTGLDTRARTSRFLCLMAEGMSAEQAAKAAKIGPWRALRIVTESDFLEIVQAIKAGAGPVAVEVAESPDTLAA